MTTTYLVTGGAGFIGSNFIQYLLETKEDIRVINVDALTYAGNLENLGQVESDPRYRFVKANICDASAIEQVMSGFQIDYLVNFAAESHVNRSIAEPITFVDSNVVGTATLLQTAKAAWQDEAGNYREGVCFLQVSTDEVYGTLSPQRPAELFSETTPLSPHSPYAATKASADLLVRAFGDTYRFPYNITRCSNNYGPYQLPEKLIPLMISHCLEGRQLPVYGDGRQIRDWLYVRDHCIAIDCVLEQGRRGEIYNIGGRNERTNLSVVKQIIRAFRDRLGFAVSDDLIEHVQDRPGHDVRYGIDPRKIELELGWRPRISFDEGLEATIDWYIAHPLWLEHAESRLEQGPRGMKEASHSA